MRKKLIRKDGDGDNTPRLSRRESGEWRFEMSYLGDQSRSTLQLGERTSSPPKTSRVHLRPFIDAKHCKSLEHEELRAAAKRLK